MSFKLNNLLLGLLLLLCSSCQTGSGCDPSSWLNAPPPPRERNYLVWSGHPAAFLTGGADAYYRRAGCYYWAVVTRTSFVVPVGPSVTETVILCLSATEDCPEPRRLKAGLVVETSDDSYAPTPLCTLRILNNDFFQGAAFKRYVGLAYNGQVIGKSRWEKEERKRQPPEPTMNWLHLDVGARKNKRKVISAVKKLYPLLKQEPDASDFLACLEPLLLEESKNK